MKTIYQLTDDSTTVRSILKLFHPDLEVTNEQLSNMIMRGSYHWMYIEGRIKNYGQVSLIVDNMHDTSGMFGSNWKLKDFEERHHKLQFRVFRTVLDKFPTDDLNDYDKELHVFKAAESYKLYPQYNKILLDAGYRVMSPQEWMEEYYSE